MFSKIHKNQYDTIIFEDPLDSLSIDQTGNSSVNINRKKTTTSNEDFNQPPTVSGSLIQNYSFNNSGADGSFIINGSNNFIYNERSFLVGFDSLLFGWDNQVYSAGSVSLGESSFNNVFIGGGSIDSEDSNNSLLLADADFNNNEISIKGESFLSFKNGITFLGDVFIENISGFSDQNYDLTSNISCDTFTTSTLSGKVIVADEVLSQGESIFWGDVFISGEGVFEEVKIEGKEIASQNWVEDFNYITGAEVYTIADEVDQLNVSNKASFSGNSDLVFNDDVTISGNLDLFLGGSYLYLGDFFITGGDVNGDPFLNIGDVLSSGYIPSGLTSYNPSHDINVSGNVLIEGGYDIYSKNTNALGLITGESVFSSGELQTKELNINNSLNVGDFNVDGYKISVSGDLVINKFSGRFFDSTSFNFEDLEITGSISQEGSFVATEEWVDNSLTPQINLDFSQGLNAYSSSFDTFNSLTDQVVISDSTFNSVTIYSDQPSQILDFDQDISASLITGASDVDFIYKGAQKFDAEITLAVIEADTVDISIPEAPASAIVLGDRSFKIKKEGHPWTVTGEYIVTDLDPIEFEMEVDSIGERASMSLGVQKPLQLLHSTHRIPDSEYRIDYNLVGLSSDAGLIEMIQRSTGGMLFFNLDLGGYYDTYTMTNGTVAIANAKDAFPSDPMARFQVQWVPTPSNVRGAIGVNRFDPFLEGKSDVEKAFSYQHL